MRYDNQKNNTHALIALDLTCEYINRYNFELHEYKCEYQSTITELNGIFSIDIPLSAIPNDYHKYCNIFSKNNIEYAIITLNPLNNIEYIVYDKSINYEFIFEGEETREFNTLFNDIDLPIARYKTYTESNYNYLIIDQSILKNWGE